MVSNLVGNMVLTRPRPTRQQVLQRPIITATAIRTHIRITRMVIPIIGDLASRCG